jgi:hypothetical protein
VTYARSGVVLPPYVLPFISGETELLCIRSDRFRAHGGNCVAHRAGPEYWRVTAGLGVAVSSIVRDMLSVVIT